MSPAFEERYLGIRSQSVPVESLARGVDPSRFLSVFRPLAVELVSPPRHRWQSSHASLKVKLNLNAALTKIGRKVGLIDRSPFVDTVFHLLQVQTSHMP